LTSATHALPFALHDSATSQYHRTIAARADFLRRILSSSRCTIGGEGRESAAARTPNQKGNAHERQLYFPTPDSAVLSIAALCGTVHAQDRTITFRMLDAKTGQRVKDWDYQAWWSDSLATAKADGIPNDWVRPDKEGVRKLSLIPASASVITAHALYGPDGWPWMNCDEEKQHKGEHWYPISDIIATGVVAPNYCSKQKATAKPGEFVFFVRRTTHWEKMRPGEIAMSPLDRPDDAATLAAVGLSPTRPLVAEPATPGEAALQYHRASGQS
jgi:hypothetical protein